MTVTEISEVSKSRVRITLDDGFAFVLYKGELSLFGVRQDKELDPENYRKIMEEVLPKRAKMRAMNLLKSRSYTAFQLTDKLKKGGYPDQIAEEALAYVSSFGYVDDRQFARDFIEYNKENKSKKRILTDLRQKGVADVIALEAWEETAGADSQKLEEEQILALINKKHFSAETASFEEKQKFMAFLFRKGFSIETIRRALSLDITTI